MGGRYTPSEGWWRAGTPAFAKAPADKPADLRRNRRQPSGAQSKPGLFMTIRRENARTRRETGKRSRKGGKRTLCSTLTD